MYVCMYVSDYKTFLNQIFRVTCKIISTGLQFLDKITVTVLLQSGFIKHNNNVTVSQTKSTHLDALRDDFSSTVTLKDKKGGQAATYTVQTQLKHIR